MGICRNSNVILNDELTPEEAKKKILFAIKSLASFEGNENMVYALPHNVTSSFMHDDEVEHKTAFCYFSPAMRNSINHMDVQMHYDDKNYEKEGRQSLFQADYPLDEKVLKDKENEGMFDVYIETAGTKEPKGSLLILYHPDSATEKGKLEFYDFTKDFAGKKATDQYEEHLKLALLTGNCRACCSDEPPISKLHWDITVGKPVPPRFLNRELKKIKTHLAKEKKFDYSYELKKKDLVKMIEFKYHTRIDGIKSNGMGGISQMVTTMFASPEKKRQMSEQANANYELRKKAMNGMIVDLKSTLDELGLKPVTLSKAFDEDTVHLYRNEREYLVISGKESNRDSEHHIYVAGDLSPEHEEKLTASLDALDAKKIGISPFDLAHDKDNQFSSNIRKEVLDIEVAQLPAYYELFHNQLKQNYYDDALARTQKEGYAAYLSDSKHFDVNLAGEFLTVEGTDSIHTIRENEAKKVREELIAENKLEYSYGKKNLLRAIKGKTHLRFNEEEKTVVLCDGKNKPLMEFGTNSQKPVYAVGSDNFLEMENRFLTDYKVEIDQLQKGKATQEMKDTLEDSFSHLTKQMRQDWCITEYMSRGFSDYYFSDVFTKEEIASRIEEYKTAEAKKNPQKELSSAQIKLAKFLEKRFEEAHKKNPKIPALKYEEKPYRAQSSLNSYVYQAKKYGVYRDKRTYDKSNSNEVDKSM